MDHTYEELRDVVVEILLSELDPIRGTMGGWI
jgi:hypothetical protein